MWTKKSDYVGLKLIQTLWFSFTLYEEKASKKCNGFGPFLEVEWPVVLPPLLPVEP
jgi:hypothetical protein